MQNRLIYYNHYNMGDTMFKKREKLIRFGSHCLLLFNFMMLYYTVGGVVQFVMRRGDIVSHNGIITITFFKLCTTLLTCFFAAVLYKLLLHKMHLLKKILLFFLITAVAFVLTLIALSVIDSYQLSNVAVVSIPLAYFIGILVFSIVVHILYEKLLVL